MNFCSCHLWENSLSTSRRLPNILSLNVSKYFLLLSQFPGSFNYFWFLNRGKAPEFSNYTRNKLSEGSGCEDPLNKLNPKKAELSLSKLYFTKLLVLPTSIKTPLEIRSACASLAAVAPLGHDGHFHEGVEWAPSLSFGEAHPSHLLLGRKLQESGRKTSPGLGQWQCYAEHTDSSTLRFPGCQGSAGAGMRLFLQCSLIPAHPCLCFCEIRGFSAFPSVTSIGPLCPWVVFAFLSREPAGETLLLLSGGSLISRAALLLFASVAKREAALAAEVHSQLW